MKAERIKRAVEILRREADLPTSTPDAEMLELADELETMLTPAFGLPVAQEPKYTVNLDGRVVNRATGEPIPDDEPMMIFRAKDAIATEPVRRYADRFCDTRGSKGFADSAFERYTKFVDFQAAHPDRVKTPD